MPTVICNVVTDASGSFTALHGSGVITVNDCWQQSALPNYSKTEYVEFTGTTFGTLGFTCGVDASPIPDGVTINSVFILIYAANLNTPGSGLKKFLIKGKVGLNLIDLIGIGGEWMPDIAINNDLNTADISSQFTPLTKAQIDGTAIGFDTTSVSGAGTATLNVYQVYLSVDYTESGADIEVTGDGGVLVSGEADISMTLQVTGSGGVLVGSIGSVTTPVVLSKDPSGIYTFIPNQHHDTLYTRNVDPDDTTDVAIPTPYGKSGYFGV